MNYPKNYPKNYKDTVRLVESLGVMPTTEPSLEPMKRALNKLGAKFSPERVVLIAGTNGKGSVAATLEALLLSAGHTTGLYTSPHLVETTERFRLDGKDISEALFCEAYEATTSAGEGLTHFELLTLMATWIFFEKRKPDWVILEVGLGGRWDATNAIDHATSILTTLDFDHQNLLGTTIQSIAANKLDILRDGNRVIHSPFPKGIETLLRETQIRFPKARFIPAREVKLQVLAGPRFVAQTKWGTAQIQLPGARGALNTATALTAFEALGFDPSQHLGALKNVRWPGRMQLARLEGFRCPVYLSGDHNPSGVRSLLEILPYYERKTLHLLVGVGKDKDVDGILAPLFDLPFTEIHLTETPFRGKTLADYGGYRARAKSAHADWRESLSEIRAHATEKDLVLITGSLYLVGVVLGEAATAGESTDSSASEL